jgi:hypothetical protein
MSAKGFLSDFQSAKGFLSDFQSAKGFLSDFQSAKGFLRALGFKAFEFKVLAASRLQSKWQ